VGHLFPPDYADTKTLNKIEMLNRTLSTFPTITTERLTLRPLLESDVQEIFLLRSDAIINKFLDRKKSETLEDALNFIRNIKKNELLYWAIAQTHNGKLIGTICLFNFSDDLNRCEIGYELLTDYQGQGIMSEAINKIIQFAILTLNLKSIDAFTHRNNQGSTNLLQKFNFEKTDIVDETNPDLIVFRLSTNLMK
jgi:ribosomal-protein-alanine N-acetyltransferase